MPAVLLVHGIWNTGQQFEPMRAALDRAGIGPLRAVDLSPNTGHAPIAALAEQVARAAGDLLAQTAEARLDVVGFSMGALVARYFIQQLGGRGLVRRYVSISGPQRGTLTAFARRARGIREMRPGSALLGELADARGAWEEVELHCLYTPFDVMILPPSSSVLEGARSVGRFPVKLHRFMLTDAAVVARVGEILQA